MRSYLHAELTSEELIQVAADAYLGREDHEDLARRSDLPKEAQQILAHSDHTWVRYALAENPMVNSSVLQELIADQDGLVVSSAVGNETIPANQLIEMAAGTPWQREGAASNPNLDAALVRTLATDDEPGVRAAVARRRNLPVDLVNLLTWDDEGYEVTVALSCNLSIPDEHWDHTASAAFLAEYRPEVLARLAAGCDKSEALTLGATWHGDVTSLVEALQLTQR